MASGQKEEFSVKEAGQNAGQAPQVIDNTTNSSQTSADFLQQKGEEVKSMAQGASEAVKNKLGMNNDYKNKNPLDRKNPNNTTCPSMPAEDHYCRISSDTSTTTITSTRLHQQYLQGYNQCRPLLLSCHLSLLFLWLESPCAPSMEFSETFQFVCQRSATGDGRICYGTVLGCPVQAESEPCVLSEGLAQAVPKV
uniref:Uncharacterized protein n=1 Tax=Brassica campestris TaxID=3711 RepID=A0A3P6CA95_BRACM|nr:unnamed protein product [Brassica rapa]